MQTKRILQAVILIIIAGVAVSCTAGKEYSGKLFAPRTAPIKDSQAITLKFLELDNLEKDKGNLVSTDHIMGRDTTFDTEALDNLAKTFPSGRPDTTTKTDIPISETSSNKIILPDNSGVAKTGIPGEIRNKRTRN